MKNVRTIIIFALIISICFIVGCENNEINEPEEYLPEEDNPVMFKIVSNKWVFDIEEEIVLTVAYGWIGYREGNDTFTVTYPLNTMIMEYNVSNIYLDDNNKRQEKNKMLIKTIDDFFLLNYKITPGNFNGKYYERYTFSYHEGIIIPNNLLEDEEGEVYFSIIGEYDGNQLGAFDSFTYKKENNQIIIEEPLYKWQIQHGIKYEIKQA